MNKNEKLELAGWVIAEAKKNGADEAAVNVNNSREIEIEFRERKIEKLQESTQNGLSLAIYTKGRYSNNSTNDLRRESLGRFVAESVAMTKYLGEDPYRSLPDPKYYKGLKDIDLKNCDPGYQQVTSDQRVKMAAALEDEALSLSDRIVSCSSSFSDGMYESVKVHSNGFEGSSRSTFFSCYVDVTIKDDQGGRPNGWDWKGGRYFGDLPEPKGMARFAVDRALAKLGQTKIESGVYEMIVENRARTSLLGALQGPMSGRNLQQKNSCLEGKLGQKVFSDKLTVIDDPFIEGGFSSRLYDSDGFPARRRVLIDKGVLKEFVIDWYYSRKLGVEPTGGNISNVVFELGNRSLDEMVKDMKKGILVNGFIGGNSNSTTGDFSFGITGTLVEDGKLIKPVNEMNVSGNLLQTWSSLIEMGNDPYMYSSLRRPSMYFKDISFTGV
ncbi:MAG: TldD/PmbA family protein [Candidatus Zixiibacteriota bacterium]|nr:MAG: TldD/PmbA family protein [candidate division Zixibacteria bacterium]